MAGCVLEEVLKAVVFTRGLNEWHECDWMKCLSREESKQKEVQISKGENVNPIISVHDSEGRFVLHFLDPATLEDPSKACVVWCRRQHRNSHFLMGAIYLHEMVRYRGVLVVRDGVPVSRHSLAQGASGLANVQAGAYTGGGGGGSPLPMNPSRSFKFRFNMFKIICMRAHCVRARFRDRSRPCFIACACDIHSTFKDLIVASAQDRVRVARGGELLTDCAV